MIDWLSELHLPASKTAISHDHRFEILKREYTLSSQFHILGRHPAQILITATPKKRETKFMIHFWADDRRDYINALDTELELTDNTRRARIVKVEFQPRENRKQKSNLHR
jgi:hypothetical protein